MIANTPMRCSYLKKRCTRKADNESQLLDMYLKTKPKETKAAISRTRWREIFPGIGPMRLPLILWGALVKTMQAHGVAYRIPQQPQWLLLYYSASPARNLLRDSPCDDDMYTYIYDCAYFTMLVKRKCP